MKPKVKLGLALSIVPQILLVKWFGSYPELVESYYSEGLYPTISKFLRYLFGWIPFSIGDLFYALLIISAIRYLYLYGKSIFKKPKGFFIDFGITLSIAYFIFHLFWGMNYYRLPIEKKLAIEKRTYTIEELEHFTKKLIQKTNTLQLLIANDSLKPVTTDLTRDEIFEITKLGYRDFAKKHPSFKYQPVSLKTSLFSLPLTYMGYGGYLNPFTGEAQVNGKTPILRAPTVSTHEIGHQIGYSSESATNFIGFLVSARTHNSYFRYASYSHALGYALSDLRKFDEEKFKIIWDTINPGVKKNYEEIRNFWDKYENPTEPIFKWMFDAFLKSNNQAQGIKSYSAVVGLLVNYDKAYDF